ncbi:MAG: hypothetical protein JNJ94_08830, partial [Chlorobi bacterium]|nr:hypothetical protein [Chlorobiota bacterium]
SSVSSGELNNASSPFAHVSSGQVNAASDPFTFVGSGQWDTASAAFAAIVGGQLNKASGAFSFIGSGNRNLASKAFTTVSGGDRDTANGDMGTVGGGRLNVITATGVFGTIAGGENNRVTQTWGTVGGGKNNISSGAWSAIGGGRLNQTIGAWASIGGGLNNVADSLSAIPGGQSLKLGGNSFGFNADTTNPTTVTDLSAAAFRSSAYFGNADVLIGNIDNNARDLRFYEPNTSFTYTGTNYTAFQAQTQTGNITYTLPASAAASNGDILTSTTGGVMSWADADSIVTANAWGLSGNSSTNPATNFLGTTNNQAFEIRVDNGGTATEGRRRVMRFEPNATSANIIGGFNGNSVTGGVVGATIAGGGANGATNSVAGHYGVVGGGLSNTASGDTSTVGGGGGNTASGDYSTVGGGHNNVVSGYVSTVGGGNLNTALGSSSTVGGGWTNQASGVAPTVSGGSNNTASGDYPTVSGGINNTASGYASTVGGGGSNTASNTASTVGGGGSNTALGFYSTVGGGGGNIASGDSSTVGGGRFNTASGKASTVGGGRSNVAAGDYATIPGGSGLILTATADRSFGFHANHPDDSWPMTISAPNVAIFSNVDLWLGNNDNAPSELRFFEAYNTAGAFPNTANYTAFKAATTQANDITYTLPATNGTAGQMLAIAAAPAPTTTAATLEWASAASSGWNLTGNGGTTVGTNFLGTTDDEPFEIRVDNGGTATEGRRRVMRFEPNATSANIIGGFNGNSVTTGAVGATIAGGGANGATNSVTDYGVVSGGNNNTASGFASTISGGTSNTASGNRSTVGGGGSNTASSTSSTVGGGGGNTASNNYSTVDGGLGNTASGAFSTVGGGVSNTASNNHATVGGGTNDTASGYASTVGGGFINKAEGDYSAIPGGHSLTLTSTADRSFGFNANTAADDRNMSISASAVAVFGNADLWLANNDGNPSELRFFEAYNTAGAFPNTANYTAFKAATTQANDITYTLPSTNGSAGQVLAIAAAPAPTATAATLEWAAAGGGGSGWSLTGNASTTPGTNFLGTTDNVAFEIRVNNGGAATGGNQRVMRYESGTTSPNIIGGFNGNTITGSSGSAIGSGGSNGAATINSVSTSNFGVIAGGTGNRIVGSTNVMIGAGLNDTITTSNYSVVGGGNSNSISGSNASVIPGGNYLKIGSNSFGFNGLSTAAQTDLSLTGANFTSVAYFGNAHVLVGNVDGTAREVRFYEPNSSFSYAATNYTGFKAQAQTANVTYTLPAAAPAGAGNGVMTSTAGGTMSWGSHRRVAVAAAGTAHVITDAAITGTNTVIVTVEGTVAFGTVTARGAGTFTVTTNAALTTADFINYVILP